MISTSLLLGSLLSLNFLSTELPSKTIASSLEESSTLVQARPEYCRNLEFPRSYSLNEVEEKRFADLRFYLPTSFFEIYSHSLIPGRLDRTTGLTFYHQSYNSCVRNNQNSASPILGQLPQVNLIYGDKDVRTGPSSRELGFIDTLVDQRGRTWRLYRPNSIYEVNNPTLSISHRLSNNKFVIITVPIIFDSNNNLEMGLVDVASIIINSLELEH